MKITLISIYPDLWSFGLRTVSSILKKEGNDVDLIFMPREFVERFPKEAVEDLVELTKDSHLAGISLMSNFWDNAIQLTEAIKENCKKCKFTYTL